MRNILDLERCTVRMPFCEIKFTVLLMNSLHQIQIELQIASSYKVCASTLRVCGVIQGSVSQTESHNHLKAARVFRLLSKRSVRQTQPGSPAQSMWLCWLRMSALARELIPLTGCSSAPAAWRGWKSWLLAASTCTSHGVTTKYQQQLSSSSSLGNAASNQS